MIAPYAPSPSSSPRRGEENHNHSPLPPGEGQGEGKIESHSIPRLIESGCNQSSAPIVKSFPPVFLSVRPTVLFKSNQGLSIVEIVVALLIISLAIVGFGMAIPLQTDNVTGFREERMALFLAKQMMEEIQAKVYEEPSPAAPGSFGPEESLGGPRQLFDDIDDYNGWNQNPPQYADGTALDGSSDTPDYNNFRRQVVVENVDDNDYSSPARTQGSTASKRVTVTVSSTKSPKTFDDVVMTWVANREGMEMLYGERH
jgi:MSHA pilin protein MshD